MSSSRRRRRVRKSKRKRYERLMQQIEQGPLGDVLDGMKVEIDPQGEDKMSEVLLEFVAPYREFLDTEEEHRKLLTVAIIAWDASFLPDQQRQEFVDKVLDAGIPTVEVGEGLKAIVDALIARKQAHFSEYTRRMVAFEVRDVGNEFRVSVVSIEGPSATQPRSEQ